MTTPVARRQAATGEPPPAWLLTALVDAAHAQIPDLDTRNPAAAAIARDLSVAELGGWGTPDSAYDAQVVISELVTNAMRHAGGVVGVRLARGGDLLGCAVLDSSATCPILAEHDWFAESGRGLHLVAALSASWGWMRRGDQGKVVWAVLAP